MGVGKAKHEGLSQVASGHGPAVRVAAVRAVGKERPGRCDARFMLRAEWRLWCAHWGAALFAGRHVCVCGVGGDFIVAILVAQTVTVN